MNRDNYRDSRDSSRDSRDSRNPRSSRDSDDRGRRSGHSRDRDDNRGDRRGDRNSNPRNDRRSNDRGHYSRSGSRAGSRGGSRPRQNSESGNLRERIAVESGSLVLIDQFMLANPQFTKSFIEVIDADNKEKEDVITKFGGSVVSLSPGTYRIERDPFKSTIIIHKEDSETQNQEDEASSQKDKIVHSGTVYLDTRCIAMIDKELLDDTGLLEKYQQLWFGGHDKACRDLLRDNGGAVRYGFSRFHENLNLQIQPGKDTVFISPETLVNSEAEVASAIA